MGRMARVAQRGKVMTINLHGFSCVCLNGKAWRVSGEERQCTCYVAYKSASQFRDIVTNSFQDYLGGDVKELKERHPENFTAPHNIGRAIVLYHYFRPDGYLFSESSWKCIASASLPSRSPDSVGEGYALWVEFPME